MTNHYDEMKVSPDPSQAEELRQRLHARLASVSADDHRGGRSDVHFLSAPVDPDARVDPVMETVLSDDTSAPSDRTHRRRLVMAAAAAIVVVGAAGIAISNRHSSDEDGSIAVTTAPTSTEGISVTRDAIRFGNGLVGNAGTVAKENGHLYVLASHYDSETDLWFRPETAVLAAFDDGGVELWRTELDRTPSDVVVADGDAWVSHADGTVSRIDASDGRMIGDVTIASKGGHTLVAAFGSVWVMVQEPFGARRLVRIDPDLSTTNFELGDCTDNENGCQDAPVAGAGVIWVPLQADGLAMIDADTNEVTVIPVDEIGHEVPRVAVDGDVVYAASDNQVTSIVNGEVVATVSPGEIWYLGPIDGTFGVLLPNGRFQVLEANDPMVVENRAISLVGQTGPVAEIDGEAWIEIGRNYDLRRVEFLPVSGGGG